MYPQSSSLSPKHPPTLLSLPICFALHLLAHFDVDFEEFGYAAVEADGFAFVEVGFAIGSVYAF
jgi:hypothetical protein